MYGVCDRSGYYDRIRRPSGSSEGGTRIAMPKTICAPDSSSLKLGSGATEGVLD